MFRIVVSLREKRSTQSQYENASVGCDLEASGLEITTPEEIVGKARQMFQMARSAVQSELLHAIPTREAQRELPADHLPEQRNGHAAANGHSAASGNGNGNGNGRSYGRPHPEPTPKQKVLLQKLAREKGLSAEQVGEIARRECGRSVPQLDRNGLSKLIEHLMRQEASS